MKDPQVFSITTCFFSSNANLEAVASLRAILYSFEVVFVYIFAFCGEKRSYCI